MTEELKTKCATLVENLFDIFKELEIEREQTEVQMVATHVGEIVDWQTKGLSNEAELDKQFEKEKAAAKETLKKTKEFLTSVFGSVDEITLDAGHAFIIAGYYFFSTVFLPREVTKADNIFKMDITSRETALASLAAVIESHPDPTLVRYGYNHPFFAAINERNKETNVA